MVYARDYDQNVLSFEPSGALKAGALVMRDRETDSWWSIMTSRAIGGAMEGASLRELPISEKTTWGRWRAQHPHTKVLAVTHVPVNRYESYLDSDRTPREIEPEDTRLPPRENVYVFRAGAEPVAVTHARIEGGVLVQPDPADGARRVLLYRPRRAPLLESTQAFWVPAALTAELGEEPARVLEKISRLRESGDAEGAGVMPVAGLDTFWFSFSMQNPGARILAE